MNILVTGATGFIGGYVIRQLSHTDYHIRCLARHSSRIQALKDAGYEIAVGDVVDRTSVAMAMHDIDWVINLAGLYSFWAPDRRDYWDVNVMGTRNVMKCAVAARVAKVVHVSTICIFGKPADLPITEDSPVGPVRFCEYARTKYRGDLVAWEIFAKQNLPLVVVYPCAVLGAGDTKPTGEVVNSLISGHLPARIMDDTIMTWVHVADVAAGIVRALEKPGNIGERYILGKEQLSFGEMYRLICEIGSVSCPRMHLPAPLTRAGAAVLTAVSRFTHKPPAWGMSTDQISLMQEGFRADGSKAERELDIRYTPVRTAVEETVAWYRSGMPQLPLPDMHAASI